MEPEISSKDNQDPNPSEKEDCRSLIGKEEGEWKVLLRHHKAIDNNVEAHGSQEHWKI